MAWRAAIALRGRPGGSVLHEGEPAHHAAPQHVEEVFGLGCGPFFDVTFEHGRGKEKACVIEGAAVGERVVGIGDGEVIAMERGTEVDHTAAIVANFKQQAGVSAAQLRIDVVVGAHGVIADVGGVGGVDEIEP